MKEKMAQNLDTVHTHTHTHPTKCVHLLCLQYNGGICLLDRAIF